MARAQQSARSEGPGASPDRELWTFVLVAFALSWTAGGLSALVVGPAALGIGALCPGIAAFWLTKRAEGNVQSLWAHVVRWRIPLRWYLAAFAVPLLVMTAAYGVVATVGGSWDVEDALPLWAAPLFLVLAFFVAGGPEEPGWRGYALPRLQSRWTALTSSLILGVIWAVWHAPLWFLPDLPFADMSYPLYAVQAVGMCVVFTWIYNGTHGSVLLAILMHASVNLAQQYLPTSVQPQVVVSTLWVAAAALIVVTCGPGDLARSARIDRAASRRLAGTEQHIAEGLA